MVLLNEPTLFMHQEYTSALASYIARAGSERHHTIFIETHNMDLIESLLRLHKYSDLIRFFRFYKRGDGLIDVETYSFDDAKKNINKFKSDLTGAS